MRCRTGTRRRTAVGIAFMLLDLGTDRVARARGCGATGVTIVLAHFAAGLIARADCRVAGTRWCAAGDDLVAWSGRRVAGTNLVARKGCRIAWSSLPMAFRRHSGNRLAWARRNDSRSFKQCGMCGSRNGRVAVIAVERKRGIFRRSFYVARLLGRRGNMMFFAGGELFWRRLRRRSAGAAIVADIARIVHDDGLVVDVGDRHVRDVIDRLVVKLPSRQ